MNYYHYPEGFADENALDSAVNQLIDEVNQLYTTVDELQATWRQTFGKSVNPQNVEDEIEDCDRNFIWSALTPSEEFLDDILLSPFFLEQTIRDSQAQSNEIPESRQIDESSASPSAPPEDRRNPGHSDGEESEDEGAMFKSSVAARLRSPTCYRRRSSDGSSTSASIPPGERKRLISVTFCLDKTDESEDEGGVCSSSPKILSRDRADGSSASPSAPQEERRNPGHNDGTEESVDEDGSSAIASALPDEDEDDEEEEIIDPTIFDSTIYYDWEDSD